MGNVLRKLELVWGKKRRSLFGFIFSLFFVIVLSRFFYPKYLNFYFWIYFLLLLFGIFLNVFFLRNMKDLRGVSTNGK